MEQLTELVVQATDPDDPDGSQSRAVGALCRAIREFSATGQSERLQQEFATTPSEPPTSTLPSPAPVLDVETASSNRSKEPDLVSWEEGLRIRAAFELEPNTARTDLPEPTVKAPNQAANIQHVPVEITPSVADPDAEEERRKKRRRRAILSKRAPEWER